MGGKSEDNEQKGYKGERLFFNFLNKFNQAFLWIRGEKDKLSTSLKESGAERPDFILLFDDPVENIAVDVSNRTLYSKEIYGTEESCFTFSKRNINNSKAFATAFNINCWLVLRDDEDASGDVWYWVKPETFETEGKLIEDKGKEKHYALAQSKFLRISTEKDFQLLITKLDKR